MLARRPSRCVELQLLQKYTSHRRPVVPRSTGARTFRITQVPSTIFELSTVTGPAVKTGTSCEPAGKGGWVVGGRDPLAQ